MIRFLTLPYILVLAVVLRAAVLTKIGYYSLEGILSISLEVATIYGVWYLTKKLPEKKGYLFADTTALFFAISPWHIQLLKSLDMNLALFLTVLGVALWIKKVNKYNLSATLVIISISLIGITGSFINTLNTSIINNQVPVWTTDEQRREHGNSFSNFLVILFHNKVVNYSLSFLEHYTQHYSGDFLFVYGDIRNNHKIADFGNMYLFDILFLISGLFVVVRSIKGFSIILLWLILSPIASSLDLQPPNMLKAAFMLVPLIVLSALGANYFFSGLSTIKRKYIKFALVIFMLIIIIWDFTRFLHQFFAHGVK